jgi:hypothetical protein
MGGITTRNVQSSLQKFNTLNMVTSCWTIIDTVYNSIVQGHVVWLTALVYSTKTDGDVSRAVCRQDWRHQT